MHFVREPVHLAQLKVQREERAVTNQSHTNNTIRVNILDRLHRLYEQSGVIAVDQLGGAMVKISPNEVNCFLSKCQVIAAVQQTPLGCSTLDSDQG